LELLTVLFIIAALVALVIPNFRWSLLKTQLTGCQANLKNVSTALQLYSNDNNDLFPDGLEKLTPDYVKRVPECPSTQKDTYSNGYDIENDFTAYTVYCSGNNHSAIGLGPNEPYYNLAEGLKP